jgi:hypothetical protein
MSIWNKILLGLIGIASLFFFHAAARTVKTYKYWSEKVVAFEKALESKRADNVSLKTADRSHPRADNTIGVQQLRIDLGRVLANRGRIWTNIQMQSAADDKGFVKVAVSSDDTGFVTKMVVYAFEEGDDQSPGKYLGEYKVDSVDANAKRIGLVSTTPLSTGLAENVAKSKKTPWVLYEMMPTDDPAVFASLPDDMRKYVPEEFLKNTKPGPNGEFGRDRRDYLAIFRACEEYRTLYQDRMETADRDVKNLKAAYEAVNIQESAVEREKTRVTMENERAQKELSAVTDHYAALQRMLAFNQMAVKAAINANLEYVKEIARRQKEAADLIDRRTHSMALNGPGTN